MQPRSPQCKIAVAQPGGYLPEAYRSHFAKKALTASSCERTIGYLKPFGLTLGCLEQVLVVEARALSSLQPLSPTLIASMLPAPHSTPAGLQRRAVACEHWDLRAVQSNDFSK